MFPIPAQEQADAILGGGKFAPGYERTYWPGVTHGFAVRGDLVSAIPSNPLKLYLRMRLLSERPQRQGW